MKIKLNNSQVDSSASNLSELLQEAQISISGVALALNGKVVPRAMWSQTELVEGDQVIVVSAVYGG